MDRPKSLTFFQPNAPDFLSIGAFARGLVERPPALSKTSADLPLKPPEKIQPHGRRARWRLRGQPMRWITAGSSMAAMSFKLAATIRALRDVDIEHPLQQLSPTDAPLCAPGRRVGPSACVRWGGRRRWHRHHCLSQLRIRCRYPMKADQMPSRHAVLSFGTTCPARFTLSRWLEMAGRVMYRHSCSSPCRSSAAQCTPACRLNR